MAELEARYGSIDAILRKIVKRTSAAKARCQNPKRRSYKYYGARGIEFRFASSRAAAEWILANLGYKPRVSLDRIDNNGHYEPGNLRWASRTEQQHNRRGRSWTDAT